MPSLVEISQVAQEKKSFLFRHYFYAIIFPWKRAGPSFEETWIPFTQGCFVPNLIEIGQGVLEKMKMLKVKRQTDGPRKTRDQKSSLEFSALVS